MTETTKRLVLCAAIGWFLAGDDYQRAMAAGGAVLFVARVVLLDSYGKKRVWR